MTDLERAARAACFEHHNCNCREGPHNCRLWEYKRRAEVEAILRELREPSEEMLDVVNEHPAMKALDELIIFAYAHGYTLPDGEPPFWQAYKAMIDHILSGAER